MLILVYFYGPGSAATKDETITTPVIVGVVVTVAIIVILSIILSVIIVVKKRSQQPYAYECHHNSETSKIIN